MTELSLAMFDPVVRQLEEQAGQQYGSFAKREPVVLGHLLAGPALGLATLLAPGHADSLAAQITAGAVALVVAVQGFVLRRFVAPAWKRTTGHDLPTEFIDEPDGSDDEDVDADLDRYWPERIEPTDAVQEARLRGGV